MEGLIVLGTRPETIKLIPVIKNLNNSNISIKILSTEQHSFAVNQLFADNNLSIDYKFDSINYTSLSNNLSHYLSEFDRLLNNKRFSFIIAQGDTISAYAGMLFAYLNKIDFIYIESGLRTHDLYNPYPEEGLRVMMSHVAKVNFVPTNQEKEYLQNENIDLNKILVVGNTGIDYIFSHVNENIMRYQKNKILLTVHRRENWEFLDIFFTKIVSYVENNPNITIIYPMHFNGHIQKIANKYLDNKKNITILNALDSNEFYSHLQTCELVITDSGGVQEEATFLNKKMIVIRDKTERTYQNQFIRNISIEDDRLFEVVNEMLKSNHEIKGFNYTYGDGKASSKIVDWIKKEYV